MFEMTSAPGLLPPKTLASRKAKLSLFNNWSSFAMYDHASFAPCQSVWLSIDTRAISAVRPRHSGLTASVLRTVSTSRKTALRRLASVFCISQYAFASVEGSGL